MHDTECVSCIDNEPGLNKDIELSEIEIVIQSLANNKSRGLMVLPMSLSKMPRYQF